MSSWAHTHTHTHARAHTQSCIFSINDDTFRSTTPSNGLSVCEEGDTESGEEDSQDNEDEEDDDYDTNSLQEDDKRRGRQRRRKTKLIAVSDIVDERQPAARKVNKILYWIFFKLYEFN